MRSIACEIGRHLPSGAVALLSLLALASVVVPGVAGRALAGLTVIAWLLLIIRACSRAEQAAAARADARDSEDLS